MSRKSWNLDRRTFLQGAGVAVGVPYLEAMRWPGMPADRARNEAPKRLCCVSFPNGCSLPDENDQENARWRWFPKGEGRDFEFTDVLRALEPFRDDLTILGGLSHPKSRELLGHLAGDSWLTAGDLRGDRYLNTVSVDQVAAHHLKQHTRYPSLVFSVDGGVGYKSRVSTLSFDFNGRPIPSEHRQRAIFERYFAAGGGETTDARREALGRGRKIVDMVLEDSKRLLRQVGKNDQEKLGEYLESLDSVEEQIKRNERWLDVPRKPFDANRLDLDPDPRVDPTAYLRATFELLVLAFELDLTRVATFMTGREDGMGFGDNFANLALGIKKGHHTISHDTGKGHWDEWGPFDQWRADQFGWFIERLKTVTDEHGPVLDRTLVLYGSCCSTTHNARNYPLALVGGGALGIEHGRYLRYQDDDDVPMSNLFVDMLNLVGVETESFADSTGRLPGLLGA